jgi:hypothetical protein
MAIQPDAASVWSQWRPGTLDQRFDGEPALIQGRKHDMTGGLCILQCIMVTKLVLQE